MLGVSVPTPVEQDMQGNAVTVAAVGMGTRRGAPRWLDGSGGPYSEADGHRRSFTRESVSVHECEVRPSFVRPWVRGSFMSSEGFCRRLSRGWSP
jgi:hypothetical protein